MKKTPNIRIIDIEEEKEQDHRRKFPKTNKDSAIQIQEAHRTPNRLGWKRKSTCYIKETALKTPGEKKKTSKLCIKEITPE